MSMIDTSVRPASAEVPVAQIRRFQNDFPACRFQFEFHLTCHGLDGLSRFCELLKASQLTLISLRCGQSGNVYCVLRDSGPTGLESLAKGIDRAGRLETWTTHVLYQ